MSSSKQEVSSPVDEFEVTVGEIFGVGEGQYAVTYTTRNGNLPKGTPVTFSLKYWKGKGKPQKGHVAILREVQMFAKGWRAFEARPVSPAISNKPEANHEHE